MHGTGAYIKAVMKVLELIKEEAPTQPAVIAKKMWKVGANIATAQAGSLRGPELFMLDLGGLKQHLHLDKQGTMPDNIGN